MPYGMWVPVVVRHICELLYSLYFTTLLQQLAWKWSGPILKAKDKKIKKRKKKHKQKKKEASYKKQKASD